MQQLAVRSPLVRLESDIATGKLDARVREEHTPVVEDNQIVCKVNEWDFPVVNSSPGYQSVDLFGASVYFEETETAVSGEEEVGGGGMEVETKNPTTVVLCLWSTCNRVGIGELLKIMNRLMHWDPFLNERKPPYYVPSPNAVLTQH